MKYLSLYEKFNRDFYFKRKNELERDYEKKIANELGNEFIGDIISDGDIDSLKFLIDTGYDIHEFEDENIYAIALKNNQIKMLEYLIDKNFYNYKNGSINSISLPDIIGEKQYDREPKQKITPQMVEWMKLMTKYGYDWIDGRYNYFDLYLSNDVLNNSTQKWTKTLLYGMLPFVDWLLKNYPDNYKLVKHLLPENLLKKYKHLDDADKYNL